MITAFDQHREAVLAFLRGHAADRTDHIFGDLLTHLLGTERLVREWGGQDLLALAALGHATYGTDGFEPHILGLGDRRLLADVIGAEAEALVYFYASCDRDDFYLQLCALGTTVTDLHFRDRFTGQPVPITADHITRFVNLTYANEAELAASSPGGPAEWTWLADFCRDTRRWASPLFFEGAAALVHVDA
ncbi:MAG TPA: hypothetical protein VHV57_07655 [Acidimicrobiales bacterium]|nr:hypothetical protein [Acidimicrobiales bacterium]